MPYAERRISFIALEADQVINYDTNFLKAPEAQLQVLSKLQEAITNIARPENADFIKWENRYDTVFDYTAYAYAQLESFRKRIKTLVEKKQFTEDDIEFLELADIYLNRAAYFRDSWYIFPEIKFSEHFYQQFFESKVKKLFEHYLYDGDSMSEFRLPIADKYPGTYDYIPRPHIIDKHFAAELIELLKANSKMEINEFIKDEARLLREILEGVVDDKYVLIIKTYI
jgi:hypothetical protein